MPYLSQRPEMLLYGFLGAKIIMSEHNLKNIQSTTYISILSGILLYTLRSTSKFRGCHTSLKNLWQVFGVCLSENTVKTEHYLKNLHKSDKKPQITVLSKTLTCISNSESKFVWWYNFFKDLWQFLGAFLGVKIVKSEQNLKNIWKYRKKT